MQCFLIVVGIFLGVSGIVESRRCISQDDIDKLIERKMETVMKKYDRKIALLEKKIHFQANQIQNQEKKIHYQKDKIRNLEKKFSSLAGAEEERENFVSFPTVLNHGTNSILRRNPEQKTTNRHVAQKRIVPGASDMVAFCAYMSTTEHSPSLHHTFVFDEVRTNIGSAYDRISGMFSAPVDGVYVLTWTMISDYHAYVYSQIVVNTEVFTGLITNSDEVGDRHSSTGVIVVHLSHNDKVYIRTNPTTHGYGNVHSGNLDGKPSFSGWKL